MCTSRSMVQGLSLALGSLLWMETCFGQCCTCNGDVNGDSQVTAADVTTWQNCFIGVPGACAACAVPDCDVDCDGNTAFRDSAAITCIISAGINPYLPCCATPGQRAVAPPLPPCECVRDADCAPEESCTNFTCTTSANVPALSGSMLGVLGISVVAAGVAITRRRGRLSAE